MLTLIKHPIISAALCSTYFILSFSFLGCNPHQKVIFSATKTCFFSNDIGYLQVLDAKNKIILSDSGNYDFDIADSIITLKKYLSPIDPRSKNLQLNNTTYINTDYSKVRFIFTKNGKIDTAFYLANPTAIHYDSTYFTRHHQFNVLCLDSNTVAVYMERTLDNLKVDGDYFSKHQFAKKFDKIGVFRISRAGYELQELFSPLKSMTFLNQNKNYMTIHAGLEQTKKDIVLTYNFADTIYFIDKKNHSVKTLNLPVDINFTYSDFSSIPEYNQHTSNFSEASENKIFKTFVAKDESYLAVITLDGIKGSIPVVLPDFNSHNWYLSVYDLNSKKWAKSHYFNGKEYSFRDVMFDNEYIAVGSKINPNSFFVIFR